MGILHLVFRVAPPTQVLWMVLAILPSNHPHHHYPWPVVLVCRQRYEERSKTPSFLKAVGDNDYSGDSEYQVFALMTNVASQSRQM
ncbi:hypothetical protein F5882DRAFT_393984 [Hyaloscypha sp. PMI_1271]|nr:hypothetical protein F5882DRAFT_423981 [Hyaloscypha sp. PMI_1271]KAH8744017.1 hypothetical protein F5882DRAFT_423710 [Hyaloscypha sp. PMI_1271]KAH8746175.1 hypothetical protein F5882DRAFT_422918 [Hyaloscypha sp. PMI_1271]KAH8799866.1 hypothetical protein F5882DRAFT_393984 [Hyaloscypha sp. PMI_1271]